MSKIEQVRHAVRFTYDLQKLRIQSGNRSTTQAVELDDKDKAYMTRLGEGLDRLEADALKQVGRHIKDVPIYKQWLKQQKGCGPTMSGLLISEITMARKLEDTVLEKVQAAIDGKRSKVVLEPSFKKDQFTYFWATLPPKYAGSTETHRILCFIRDGELWQDCCSTPSALWRYCGLAVDTSTGKAERRTKGQKAHFNPWLKSKVLHVLGGCLIKANSPWRKHYDDYKFRKENQQVPVCMCCKGKGVAMFNEDGTDVVAEEDADLIIPKKKKPKKEKSCHNCGGTGRNAPWGTSKAHRHNAAMRYMMKMFLLEFWTKWRTLEGLPITEPYSVAVLGRVHGDHNGMGGASQAYADAE